ncbi:XRE family transcriptional regulator [Propioniciclava sinopodophylli]|uniref:XRE family transcriptional regulator n=1 Tax=Propioniciclava sinopodophylli TaxID=1837344 RepID=A0A4Q9KC94_9ACTN|nr:helix-turn-helix transcriptional regulator [Propioniciclava sinopodophylli]TBT83791.1 XRE family transcriptional regulator [Propioniciclava sinopodophylli]
MTTNTCTNTRCDRPATHAVEFPRSSPIDPTPFTRLQCETHARRNVEQLGATMTDLPGVEADARPVVEGDAFLDAARAYVARWRTVSRFTGAEPVGEAGAVRVWYVGPSAARARDGQPIEAEFCEVVGAWELARELAPESGGVEAVEVEPDWAELLRLTRNRLLAELVSTDVARVGLSVEQAAERARIAPETLARRLAGETFTMPELGALADVCGVRASTWITSVDNTLADARKVAS